MRNGHKGSRNRENKVCKVLETERKSNLTTYRRENIAV